MSHGYTVIAIFVAAAMHRKCLAWLLQYGPACQQWNDNCSLHEAFSDLATGGHLGAMIYIHDHGRPIPEDSTARLLKTAAETGHLPMVQWLRSLDPPDSEWPKTLCIAAAGNGYKGNLRILQWLRDQNPPAPWFTRRYEQQEHPNAAEWMCSSSCD